MRNYRAVSVYWGVLFKAVSGSFEGVWGACKAGFEQILMRIIGPCLRIAGSFLSVSLD